MSRDYKDTLNLPKTAFPMKANLTQREPEFLKLWEERDIYKKMIMKNEGNPPFILHDGPPYANGHIHMGHALNKVLKDIIVKYKSMKGFYSPYVPGWDCHGLPIELQVDKKLGKKKHETSITEKRKLCREYAERFVGIQREEFRRLGVFGDWESPYLTMTYPYESAIAEEFIRFIKSGHVYKGKKPVHWCPSCVTALAEAEVEYNDKVSPSIFVRFKATEETTRSLLTGDDRTLYFVIWTTTPWTLPANLALAVNPEVEYSVIGKDGEAYIVAKDLAGKLSERIGLDGDLVKTLKGSELEGYTAKHPFIDRLSKVITGEFVSTEEGTGIVHIAPGHGEDDYLAGLRYGLDIYAPVDDLGRFTTEDADLKGEFVFKANERIIEILRENSSLMGSGDITHSYPHCWRCKKPVIFRATEQWFISVDKDGLRNNCLDEIDRVRWIPHWGKERIRGMVERRPDWCVSRQRAWGVPITVLNCKNCGDFVKDDAFFDRVVEVFRRQGSDAWFNLSVDELLPDGYSCPSCGSKEFEKETDILDVWFDSGVSHAAVLEKDGRLRWPADMYLEGSDQHRGWFQSSLFASVGTRRRAPYDIVLTHGFVVDGEGKKMSKSVGNVIAPEDIIKKNGAEVLRIWVSAEDYRNDVRLSSEILNRLVEAYRKIRNTCRFLLGNLYDFDLKDYSSSLLEIDRWAMSRLQNLIKTATKGYEEFDFHIVFRALYNFCVVDMSSFYLDILKDRLYTFAPASAERRAAQWTIYRIVHTMARLMAPVLSFMAEEVWQHIPGEKPESVFLADFPTPEEPFIDKNLESRWEELIDVREVVNKAIELKRSEKFIGNSLEASVTVFAGDKYAGLLRNYSDFLPTLFIVSQAGVSELSRAPETGIFRDEEGREIAVLVEHASGSKCARCWNWSETVGTFSDEPEICHRCHNALSGGKG
ncbi:MAG: isoleucine--tRNA ligase [Nitrospirae bacterium]|nr:MAG: isoleucine--tRNA ligase [Nitrospirota bacterium]